MTTGVGWTQGEDDEVVEIRAGDIVWCPPGQRYWDGATPEHALDHIAVQKAQHGRAIGFGEQVTDKEYRLGPSSASSRR